MRRLIFIISVLLASVNAMADGRSVTVATQFNEASITLDWSDDTLRWSASSMDIEIIAPSRLRMETSRGVWGEDVGEAKVERYSTEEYSGAIVEFDDFAVEIRAYEYSNLGVAYRFISKIEGDYTVTDELAEFTFGGEEVAWIPYTNFRPDATSDYATQFETSFENTYTKTTIKDIDPRRLIFTPIVVDCPNRNTGSLKVAIVESNLEEYPGMFLSNRDQDNIIDTEFAPVPDVVEQGGYNMLQGIVKSRKPYIAECSGKRTFPWRGLIISAYNSDIYLANNRLVWELADECRIKNPSWIKPGKVAWEWWNDWGLEGVDFEPGINNQTYKYYIDFASRYGIEYVILDEGWSVKGEADLYNVVPEIDIPELVAYGKKRGVGIILWAGYWALNRDIEGLCKHYSKMGVKGFKVDFMDRDDQEMVRFVYDLAEIAAKYKLLVDYHGIYKPTGLQRTYPNAINFEGVHGLETMKWLGREHDQITYDVTIPYIRGLAGPMDYTPGAMRNASREEYEPSYSRPMSQGTRCHQLAMYVAYNQPLAMLSDSPTEYEKEPEFTKFLATIPTTWDEWSAIDGEIGEYIVVRSEKEGNLYYAGLNGNTSREVTILFGCIGASPDNWHYGDIEIYSDKCDASTGYDYKRIETSGTRYVIGDNFPSELKIRMAPGGGFVIKTHIRSSEDMKRTKLKSRVN
ncbi:MAG: glycoside hydrolase family 97 protein [Rikenellaceae bacterium]|nr:glycoside hydrolase family 97 protein [Rikenellaceae bacterium]